MALYSYKKGKVKMVAPKTRRPFVLPMLLLMVGFSILGYVGYPYFTFFISQTFKVDNVSKEFLSPENSFKAYAQDNPEQANADQNIAQNIAEVDKEIKNNSQVSPEILNQTGKMYLTIPKINLKHVPININTNSSSEDQYANILLNNLAHFKGSSLPGYDGKTFIYGHSGAGILNGQSYKNIFNDLKKVDLGDTFSIEYNNKTYNYSVYRIKLVSGDDTSVIYSDDKQSTVALMTCDPPGISVVRLIVEAVEQ